MPKTIVITAKETDEIRKRRKEVSNKNADRRLHAVQLRGEGYTNAEIAKKLDTSPKVVSRWVALYHYKGIDALALERRVGNRRNASEEEEQAFLEQFKMAAENGQIITVAEIAEAYDRTFGKKHASYSTVYHMLHRRGWRKVMPRSRHPQKASDEAIEASNKSTPDSES